MSRGLSDPILTESGKNKNRMLELVEFHFSTVVYLTNAHRDINWNSNDYLSDGNLMGLGSINETVDLKINSSDVTLSGVNQDNIAIALLEDFIDIRVVRYRGFFISDVETVHSTPLFDGRIDSFVLNEDISNRTSTIVWSLASHWSDFEKIASRRTNHNDQIARYPGDLGCAFADKDIRDIKWGRA